MKQELDILPDDTRQAMDRTIRCFIRMAPNCELEVRRTITSLVMTAFYDGLLESKNTLKP